MKNRCKFLCFAALFALISSSSLLVAQNMPSSQPPADQTQQSPQATPPSQQSPDPQAQPSQQSPSQAQTSGDSAQPTADSSAKEFVGTVVKQGDKYVFQDAASGNTYDIDRQDEVKKFEGKRVRVHGTLDASGKSIHVQ